MMSVNLQLTVVMYNSLRGNLIIFNLAKHIDVKGTANKETIKHDQMHKMECMIFFIVIACIISRG